MPSAFTFPSAARRKAPIHSSPPGRPARLPAPPELRGRAEKAASPDAGCPCGCGCPRCKAAPAAGPIPTIVHNVLREEGRPLDAAGRGLMVAHFGHDFRSVRVHTGDLGAESARAVGAAVYTVGADVVFGAMSIDVLTRDGQVHTAGEYLRILEEERIARQVARERLAGATEHREGGRSVPAP